MTRPLFLSLLFAGTIALTATGLKAEPACAPRPETLERLTDGLGQTRRAIALAGTGVVVETFAGPDGRWTMIVTRPDGISCHLASGRYREAVDESPIPGEPA